MNPQELELRAFGVGRNWDAATWQRYREWAQENPRGGMACNSNEPRQPIKERKEKE